MFEVEYKGANAVIITTKTTKVVFDPESAKTTGSAISVKDAVEVNSEDRFAAGSTPKLRINSPGEYEVGDVAILGLPVRRHINTEGEATTIYRLVIGEARIAVIGNIAPKLTDAQLEAIGVVDVVILPVGGNGYTLDATSAAEMVRQLDPKVVIPVHYADSAVQYEVPQDNLEVFLSELSASTVEAGGKWKLKNDASLPEQLTIIKIERS